MPATFAPPRLLELGRSRVLIVPLGGEHDVLSWAIVNGGRRRASAVVWREVSLDELGPWSDAAALLRGTLAAADLPSAVGLLTARDVRTFSDVAAAATDGDGDGDSAVHAVISARCVATVGLANAVAVGDPPRRPASAGTINIFCQLSVPLTDEALIESLALATEARTAAMLEARIPSPLSGRPSSGTGTDCIVMAAPVAEPAVPGAPTVAAPVAYAGKHTRVGALVGSVVREAVARGIARRLEGIPCQTA
jgi:adenosylcobinamide amidohydrolase